MEDTTLMLIRQYASTAAMLVLAGGTVALLIQTMVKRKQRCKTKAGNTAKDKRK